MNFLCAATHPALPRTNLEKKWSLKVEPGGERCLTVCIERESGMSSIRAVLCGGVGQRAGVMRKNGSLPGLKPYASPPIRPSSSFALPACWT